MSFGNDIIQAGLIDKAISVTAIASLVTNSESIVEIREAQWQGTDFEYPAIRLRLEPTEIPIEECGPHKAFFVWECFSENASSLECMQLQTAIHQNFPKSFTYSTGGQDYLFTGIKVRTISRPFRLGQRTWQGNISAQALVR